MAAVQSQLKEKFGFRWAALDIDWRLWANTLVSQNSEVNVAELDSVGPPSHMLHYFSIVPPTGVRDSMISRVSANNMAITALRDARMALERVIENFEIVERYLRSDISFAEETAASLSFIDRVAPQEDVDHS